MLSNKKKITTAPNLKRNQDLTIYEISIYFFIVILNIIYMLYQVYKAGAEYFDEYFLDLYNDFSPGWSWLNRNKDVGDSEWILGTKVLYVLLPFLLVHLIISECLKRYEKQKFIQLWHILTGVTFVFKYLGNYALILFVIQPLAYYLIVQFSSRKLIWITTVIFLIVQHYFIDLPLTENNNEDLDNKDKLDITIVSLAWTNLRCVNFFLDALKDKEFQQFTIKNLVRLFSYIFYLPTLYHGPIILFSDFRSSQWFNQTTKQTPLSSRITILIIQILRYCFWWFIVEIILHYLYANSMLFHIDLLKSMNYHALYGVGYLMGQLFYLKYVVFYGISCCITNFELECPVPPHPKCISRIYLYSDMWKNFDRGLYLFMVKYIYKPCAKAAGRLISSLICFTFVFVWHGLYPHVLIWSLLNYVGVSIESFGKEVANLEDFDYSGINQQMFRRIKCILASPLLLMSAIAFFYYHGGKEIGDVFVQRILFVNILVTLATLFVLYCYCQVCMEIDNIEETFKFPPNPLLVNESKKQARNFEHEKESCITQKGIINNYIHQSDRLQKFKSTGQIQGTVSKRPNHSIMRRSEKQRLIPLTNAPITNPTHKDGNWSQNLTEITPLTLEEDYVEVKNVKGTILTNTEDLSPTKEIPYLPKNKSNVPVIVNKNVEKLTTELEPKEKKKDILSRIDTIYKTKIKEKKRKLWNLDRKEK